MSDTVRKTVKPHEAHETESVSTTDSNATLRNVRWCPSTRVDKKPIPKIKKKKPRTPLSPLPVPALMAAYLEKSAATENQKNCYSQHVIHGDIHQRVESLKVTKEQRITRPAFRRENQPPRWDSTAKVVRHSAPPLKSRPAASTKYHDKKIKPIYNTK